MTTPTQLASLPVTDGHIERAKEAVRAFPARQNDLNVLLASDPTRGQIVEFTEAVDAEAAAEQQLNQRINAICKFVGIEKPSRTERLMAMQVGLLQDQNTILQGGVARSLNQMRTDTKAGDSSGTFTALVGGMTLGTVLTR